MEKIWQIKSANPELQEDISRALGLSPACAQVLINRGIGTIQEAEDFLSCDLADLHDPLLFKGMGKAVRRIQEAIARRQRMMVWGDYDIDGITGVCLLVTLLREMGADVSHYIPNRLKEGYGLNKKGLAAAKAKGTRLLISVDCGISAQEEIRLLKEMGMDTIICDHHLPKEDLPLPEACAIINPLQKDCPYPYKYLSGVGIAAKLAAALKGNQQEIMEKYLDIIVLGTVGDIVPLTGENRILVKHGLASLSRTKRVGLVALLEVAGLADKEITVGHIGYILGPRINASGRLGSPEDSLRLILTEDEAEARTLARRLEQGNRARQKIESQTLQEAIAQVESKINFKEHNIIVLGAPHWHQGVIGIVASRLVERYFRPTIMLSSEDIFWRGSGRSIGSFHLLEALNSCRNLLEEYGGHRRACGLRLKKERLDDFFRTINQAARKMLTAQDLIPVLEIDMAMPLANLSAELIEQFSRLEPFGIDNPRPLICSHGLQVKSRTTVVAGGHLKFWVTDGQLTCEAIGYNKAAGFAQLQSGELIDLVYSPSLNNWQGQASLQLKVEDLKIR